MRTPERGKHLQNGQHRGGHRVDVTSKYPTSGSPSTAASRELRAGLSAFRQQEFAGLQACQATSWALQLEQWPRRRPHAHELTLAGCSEGQRIPELKRAGRI